MHYTRNRVAEKSARSSNASRKRRMTLSQAFCRGQQVVVIFIDPEAVSLFCQAIDEQDRSRQNRAAPRSSQ
jgi:hypothetical protein